MNAAVSEKGLHSSQSTLNATALDKLAEFETMDSIGSTLPDWPSTGYPGERTRDAGSEQAPVAKSIDGEIGVVLARL